LDEERERVGELEAKVI
jgi:vacuolar-type H+-ATPase subunit I/STV1